MEIHEYANQQKKLYETIMKYLSIEEESQSETENKDESQYLKDIFEYQSTLQKREGFRTILSIITKISENHHRTHNFFNKIEKILTPNLPQIKQTFTNSEIFKIFQNNKRILLYLFEQKIITPEESILPYIRKNSFDAFVDFNDDDDYFYEDDEFEDGHEENQRFLYSVYFYPEIKSLIDEDEAEFIEGKLREYTKSGQEIFSRNRQIGENESELCELIRQDSVEEFIAYVHKENISLKSRIKLSIYETNPLLIKRNPTLIEYAAFYGSIQIFQYLIMNQIELKPSLWIYAIHSDNDELIQLLESNNVKPQGENYKKCLKESIKCHNSKITQYILTNLISNDEKNDKNVCSFGFEYYNFSFLIDYLNSKYAFHYSCKYGYLQLVELYLKYSNVDINASINDDISSKSLCFE